MALRRFDIEAGGDSFSFKPETEEKIRFWRDKYPEDRQRSAVIPMLWLAQKDNGGWLSEPAMREVADRLEMPYIRVYEVATFYTMFRLQPVGANHIQLCGTTPCMLRGANELKEVCRQEIGPPMKVTDDGRLSWEEVECLGACVNAPMVQVNDDYIEDLTAKSFAGIIERLRNGAKVDIGPQIDRVFSAPAGGTEALTEPELFDGSRNSSASLPNLSEPESESGVDQAKEVEATKANETPVRVGGAKADLAVASAVGTAKVAGLSTQPNDASARADVKRWRRMRGEDLHPREVRPTRELFEKNRAELEASKDNPSFKRAVTEPAPSDEPVIEGDRPQAFDISSGKPDDLKRIKGIGPKNEQALNALGIYTFAQISEWTPSNISWVEGYLSFPGRIEREDWINQAKLLAAGAETEFSKRVDAGEVESSKSDEDKS